MRDHSADTQQPYGTERTPPVFHCFTQTCAAAVHLPAQRGVCLRPCGLRHPLQPPAVFRLPGAAGGAGAPDPYRHPGA